MANDVDTAVRLVKQAIIQDSKRNYPEAARCYRDALQIFSLLHRDRSIPSRLREFLTYKVVQYEERLKVIDAYLLSQNDWTKFFKDLEPYHTEDCRSSVSSDSRHLYQHPLLANALDSLRRGKKADERENYRLALSCYETGVSSLQGLINKGLLTDRQVSAARAKCLMYHDRAESIRAALERGHRLPGCRGVESSCLSLTSVGDSLVPTTEAEQIMQMDEVHSCSSRLGSTTSLNCSSSPLPRYPQPIGHESNPDAQQRRRLDRSHEVLHGSLPHLGKEAVQTRAGASPLPPSRTASRPSLHSLYPTCEIMRPVSALSGVSSTCRPKSTVPLACLQQELKISSLSLASSRSSYSNSAASLKMTEEEFIDIHNSCEDVKDGEYAESDSGYSDPSPDGTLRDAKSPDESDEATPTGRKSPFSDISEVEEEEQRGGDTSSKSSRENDNRVQQQRHSMQDLVQTAAAYNTGTVATPPCYRHSAEVAGVEIIPNVIIKNESSGSIIATDCSPAFPRRFARQRSVFQNPEKDILTSQVSRDDLAVIGQEDCVDTSLPGGRPLISPVSTLRGGNGGRLYTATAEAGGRGGGVEHQHRRHHHHHSGRSASPEVYSRQGTSSSRGVPSRATARQQHKEEKEDKNACFYIMTALDFCWCL